jgi:flagellar M-ring protein FliF
LAKAAVGFETERGDEVVVENVGFSSNVPEVATVGVAKLMDEAQDMLRGQPELLKSVGMGGLILLLVMVVVRPLTRQMVTAMNVSAEPRLLATSSMAASEMEQALSMGASASVQAQVGSGAATANVFEHVSQQIRQEPVQSTRLLQTWIGEPVEERKN